MESLPLIPLAFLPPWLVVPLALYDSFSICVLKFKFFELFLALSSVISSSPAFLDTLGLCYSIILVLLLFHWVLASDVENWLTVAEHLLFYER